MNEQVEEESAVGGQAVPAATNYAAVADRISENMTTAALRVGDAAQDLVGLMNDLITAGKVLESALSIQRELGAASLKAVGDAREAAESALAAATGAHDSRTSASDLLQQMNVEYGTVSGLVDDLQQRIAALAVLGTAMSRRPSQTHEEAEPTDEQSDDGGMSAN